MFRFSFWAAAWVGFKLWVLPPFPVLSFLKRDPRVSLMMSSFQAPVKKTVAPNLHFFYTHSSETEFRLNIGLPTKRSATVVYLFDVPPLTFLRWSGEGAYCRASYDQKSHDDPPNFRGTCFLYFF